MRTLIDFDDAPVFAIGRADGSVCEGVLIEGPQGWGEFSPPPDSDVAVAARWLTAATEPGTVGWPDPVRGQIPVAVRVPAVDPVRAHQLVVNSGCRTADVTVADEPDALAADIARVEAVRDALGPDGAIRCDARRAWGPDAAARSINALEQAAGGIEFVTARSLGIDELVHLRSKVETRIAIDAPAEWSDRLAEAADVVVLTCGPHGGVRRALRLAERYGLPAVVSSAGETSIGLSGALALAGALADLPFACGLDSVSSLRGDLVTDSRSLLPADGFLPVAPMPPAPDRARLRRYAVTDPQVIDRWRRLIRTALAGM